jgi:hypothetical protein
MGYQVGLKLLALTAFVVSTGATIASAGETGQISVQCAVSDQIPTGRPGLVYTTCFGDAQFRFQSEGVPTAYGLKFTAPTMHCSAVNYQVYATYDPNLLLGKTRNFLEPGQSEIVPIGNDFARGLQVVNVRALGKVGGCNTGRMQGWSATVEVVIIP